jgi:hypothetical protein
MREGLRGLLRRLVVVLALLGLVVAAAAAFGQSNRYPAGRAVASLPTVMTAGTYTNAAGGTITVDAQGRVTAIATVTRTLATTAPLAGGGTLAADRTLSCPTCATYSNWVTNRIPLSSGTTGGLTTDPALFWGAAGPTLNLQGLFKPYRIAGGNATPPTAAAGAGAQLGTGATCTVTGSDMNGYITLTTGTGPTAMTANSFNTLCTVTFNAAYSGGARSVLVHPGNPAAAALMGGASPVVPFVDPTTTLTTSFPIRIVSPATPTLPASTALIYEFVVIQ